MNKPMSREKTLYRYQTALERGDFATVAAILHQAEQDATLARMLLELNAALELEADAIRAPQAVPRSTNGHRPTGAPAKEELSMSVYEMTYSSQARTRGRMPARKHALTLIAAMIAVVLLGVALLNSGLTGSINGAVGSPGGEGGPEALPGAAQQVVSATPSATFTPTPVPALTATPFGPQADPLILNATSAVEEATRMAQTPFVVTATMFAPTMVPFVTVPGGVDDVNVVPLSPTVVPPEGFSMSGMIGPQVGMLDLSLDTTATFNLAAQDVNFFRIMAEEDGALVITATSLDFAPRLVVIALDDANLEIRRNQDDQSPPVVTVPVSAGDRVLIFVYSVDREASGQFLINTHME